MNSIESISKMIELANEILENEKDQEARSKVERAIASYKKTLRLAKLVLSVYESTETTE